MARGRMLATTIADDKRFNTLPIDAALVYLMAIPQLDRDGLILGEPVLLWGQVCRRRTDLMQNMANIIEAWVTSGLVTAYKTDDGDTVLHFTGFQKNQTIRYDREGASRFPCPPGFIRTEKGLEPDGLQPSVNEQLELLQSHSRVTPELLQSYSRVTPELLQPNVIQSNVIQVKENQCSADAVPTEPTMSMAAEFSDVQAELKTSNNKAAVLHRWYVRCFGADAAPDYGYLGRVAKQVGGAGHLAQLMLQLSSRPPAGDVLAYIQKMHGSKENGHSNGYGYGAQSEGMAMPVFTGSEK